MNVEIPAQAVVAIATVVAALITGVIAMVNLTLGKEQKVSEMRQAWIDALRDDIAKYFAGISIVSLHMDEAWDSQSKAANYHHKRSSEQIDELLALTTEALYRIQLRLNADEATHQELERLLSAVRGTYRDWSDGEVGLGDAVAVSVARAQKQARIVLKDEWERVKQGEPIFRDLRRWIAPTVVVLVAFFVVAILFARYK